MIVQAVGVARLQRLRREEIQRQQAETSARQFRLALLERRMTVFDGLMDFLAEVGRAADVKLPQTFAMLRKTREHEFLFGADVNDLIDKIYSQAVDLNTRRQLPHAERNFAEETKLVAWLIDQLREAKKVFLPYIDFRQP